MVETDWRRILNLSQKELTPEEKEDLCESLSWMEADDIELNFSDMKSLFRLAQDILKFKNEQVNTLTGKLEIINRKTVRKKSSKKGSEESPKRFDDHLETITHQEEIIKTNKEIIKQLYEDISELEKQRDKLESEQNAEKREIENSDSSRDPMSEIAAIEQLEKDLVIKNKHIRKLLTDIKICEDENGHLKSKLTILKVKLSDATNIIEKHTKQIYMLSSECSKLKDALGKSQENKSQLKIDIDGLKQHIFDLKSNKDSEVDGLRSKIQHWKNIARSKKSETEALVDENMYLKSRIDRNTIIDGASKVCETQNQHMKQLEEKLTEATKEIIQSAKMIELLKLENRKLKNYAQKRSVYYMQSDRQDKQRDRLEQREKLLNVDFDSHDNDLKEAQKIIALRENEISELRSELKIYQRGKESIATILENIKSKERQLKLKDESVKSLVKEINMLNKLLDSFQLENETMRKKLNIAADAKISVRGIIKKFKAIEMSAVDANKKLLKLENNYVNLKLDKRNSDILINKMKNKLIEMGFQDADFNIMINEEFKEKGQGDGPHVSDIFFNENRESIRTTSLANDEDMKAIAEENEGLRKGLQEILDYIKDNVTGPSGTLSLECPSLEVVLRSMEARHAAGWFAPHMTAMLELQAAIGGRDALLVALNNARKETLDVMTQLQQESQKTLDMEVKLREMESKENIIHTIDNQSDEAQNYGLFGTWVTDDNNVNDFNIMDKNQLDGLILKNNSVHELNIKNSLEYFQNKFKELYQKMSDISIQASDDLNQWLIKEENYKAEIENFKSVLASVDEQVSDSSPGVVYNSNDENKIQRKCAYLEESYRYIRTLNENIKNEHFDYKREAMIQVANYENKIQTLVLRVANLTDKLRNSISFDIFLKQNEYLHELNTKYRSLLENKTLRDPENIFTDLVQKLEQDKNYIIDLYKSRYPKIESNENNIQQIETDIIKKQLQSICNALDEAKVRIQTLEQINEEVQINQSKIIDNNTNAISKEEVILLNDQINNLAIENKGLKEQCQHVSSQLEIAMLQLQKQQSKQMTNDMEINMLRHQVLDLQSTGDNKAIIARLGGEVLIAHLQATDNHKKIDRLHSALNKEKQNRVEAEEMLKARENIFDLYASRYENKFKFMLETINTLRLQYHGSLPVVSLETFINNLEELVRKNEAADDKLSEIEDIREVLNAKLSIFDELLSVTKVKCLMEDDKCNHYIQKIVNEGIYKRELNLCSKKIEMLEHSRKDILKRCNFLEKTLLLINQNVNKLPIDKIVDPKESTNSESLHNLELEDILSDDEQMSRKSQTISLPKPKILSAPKPESDMTKMIKSPPPTSLPGSPLRREFSKPIIQTSNVFVQTNFSNLVRNNKYTQSDEDIVVKDLKENINLLQDEINIKQRELNEALILISNKNDDILKVNAKIIELDTKIENLDSVNRRKDDIILKLQNSLADLNMELQNVHSNEKKILNSSLNEENNRLILAIKKLESDKHMVIEEYRQMLQNERDEYANNMKNLQKKILELQSQINRSNRNLSNPENSKEIVSKYTVKIVELEDNNFKLQNELDGCKAEISTYESTIERWKSLAIERLKKMEQLNNKLEERHSHEVESYKAENQHWLSQLNDSQREHSELRFKMNDQKSVLSKQITDKDTHIEHMKSVINNLKTQIMNMQTLISVNDPSFDLSAIIEVDESSDLMSQQASDRLEIKFDSTLDLQEYHEEMEARPSSSSSIWQEPLIERLRREKQQICKQNAILRRQIKALAGRERRARLEAQNLKNQVYRMSSSGSKAASAESAVLHNKISALQAQLDNARHDSHNSVALWDKWKRSQQAAERWQARFEEKCREVKKFDTSLNFTKSALTRLEREKKILLAKLNEINNKCDDEEPYRREETEKALREAESEKESRRGSLAGTVSVRALMDRVEAQQRRIVVLELAEKGNEPLVTEYEKALAEITSLKGQILKLESSVLESQIRSPMTRSPDPQPQLEYWKSYCEMLKEENMQLSLKVSTMDAAQTVPQHQRVNDLEQTVLTLRGLVTKLQSEQKYSSVKRQDSSSPNSGRSIEKTRGQVEFYRTELSNLRKSLSDKDNLLEKSKDMLRMAAEREEDLLRENAYLRHQLNDMESGKGGFLSALD